jgi:L-alanine-DL-glutamate epimerase-like enolase superfamily enzyme
LIGDGAEDSQASHVEHAAELTAGVQQLDSRTAPGQGTLVAMRITGITFERLRLPLDPPFHAAWDPVPRACFDSTLVRVHTDDGLVGIGSGDAMTGLDAYAHLFLGKDPLRLAHHARVLETIEFHAGRPWPLEAALWDLAGQALGIPCATLAGGATDRLPAYASWGELRAPEQRAEDAAALVERGVRAVKVRIARTAVESGLAVVRAVRAVAGDQLDILVDLNQWWRMPGDVATRHDPAASRRILERLAEDGVLWVEEPLPGGDRSGMRALRERTGVAIAGGEMARTLDELLLALDQDALDVFQPDVVLTLGMWRARLLAELVLHRNRHFTPHTWSNGIGLLANLHLVCGVGGGPYVEYPYDPPGWTPERRDHMLVEPVGLDEDGCLRIPDRAGLGVHLDEEAVAHYRIDSEATIA